MGNDYDSQRKILADERKNISLNHRYYKQVFCLAFLCIIIIVIAHFTIYIYDDKNLNKQVICENVNISDKYNIYSRVNITDEGSCTPKYNIDYYGNGKVLFNIDVYGDKSLLFNKVSEEKECKLNCDINEDGYPDFNIDLNGDGTADLNISDDNQTCQKSCDKNHDMLANDEKKSIKVDMKTLGRLNFDINYDGICDLNCDIDNDLKADLNIDLNDDNLPDLNIDSNNDKTPDISVDSNKDNNCDDACLGETAYTKDFTIDISKLKDNKFDINLEGIEPGSEGKYALIINNDKTVAFKGKILWQNINNGYTEYNNLKYNVVNNYKTIIENETLPFKETSITDIIIAPHTKVMYILNIQTSYYSSNTIFKGEITIK